MNALEFIKHNLDLELIDAEITENIQEFLTPWMQDN